MHLMVIEIQFRFFFIREDPSRVCQSAVHSIKALFVDTPVCSSTPRALGWNGLRHPTPMEKRWENDDLP